jgi:Putative prokaryotic signal transducing protein
MTGELVTVFRTTNSTEAVMYRNALRAEGISCEIDNIHQAGLAGILDVRGFVQAADEERAKQILTEYQKQAAATAEAEIDGEEDDEDEEETA